MLSLPCKPETRNGNEISNYMDIFRATCWRWWLTELLPCGGAGGWPGLGQGMSCFLQSPCVAASSWACRELMQGRSSLNWAVVPSCCSERPGWNLPYILSLTVLSWSTQVSSAEGWGSWSGSELWEVRGLSEAPAPAPSWQIPFCCTFRQIQVQISAPLCLRLGSQEVLRWDAGCLMESTPVILRQQGWTEEKVNLGWRFNVLVGWVNPEEYIGCQSCPGKVEVAEPL